MLKKYQDEEGNFYDAILYTGYNAEDVIEFLENRPIVFLDDRPIVYSYSLLSDQYNDGTSKTYIDIKIDFNNTEDHIYLFTYEYLVYDIKKKYYYTYKPEIFDKNFKEVNMIEKKSITEDNSSVSNIVSILGTEYKLFREPSSSWKFVDGIMGRCDSYLKEISISILNRDSVINKGKPDEWFFLNEAEIARHEIVHAFLNESGLSYNTKSSTSWATNEEMIDWIALQADKISKAFKEAEAWLRSQFNI